MAKRKQVFNPVSNKFDLVEEGGGGGGGIVTLPPASVATTANLVAIYDNGVDGVGATLTNDDTLAAFEADGVNPSVDSRVLVKDQTNQFENGIYVVTTVGDGSTPWVLTRAANYDTADEITPGGLIPILGGATQSGQIWVETNVVVDVGVDPINFVLFQTSSAYTPWQITTSTSVSLLPWDKYIANSSSQVEFTLPAIAEAGSELELASKGSGGWKILQGSGQSIQVGLLTSSTGVGGSVECTSEKGSIRLVCITANTQWEAISSFGNFNVV